MDIREIFFLCLFNSLPDSKFFNTMRPLFLKFAGANLPIDGSVYIAKYVRVVNPKGLTIHGNFIANNFCYLDCNGGVEIFDGVRMAAGVKLLTTFHEGEHINVAKLKPVIIGGYSHIGADSTILGGVVIGSKTIVAPNSLVLSNLNDESIYSNMSARFIANRKFD